MATPSPNCGNEDEPKTKRMLLDPFMDLLVTLSKELTPDEFAEMKIICVNFLPTGDMAKMKVPGELFVKLYEMNIISEDDTAELEKLLCKLQRQDLIQKHLKRQSNVGNLSNIENDQLIALLKLAYRKHFRNHKPIPWNKKCNLNLEEVYTQLEVKEVKRGKFEKGQVIHEPSAIFKSVHEESASTTRISIEGAPAIGKSTLCGKIAYDWAQGKLDKYKLVFYLEMRYVTKGKIVHEIINQLIPRDRNLSTEKLLNFILSNEKSVLFLLDGLDEIHETKLKGTTIPDLISGHSLPWCTVVITTRPHKRDKYLSDCDLHFSVKGFSEERMKEYITKYFQGCEDNRDENLLKEIKRQRKVNKNVFRKDLLANPLHVSFLCILWEDGQGEDSIQFPTTITSLYSEIQDCILKRYCAKNNYQLHAGKLPQVVIDARDKLAADACKLYLKGESVFTTSDISSDVSLDLGLLVRNNGPSRTKVQELYFFCHKTWLEFFSAVHLTSEAKSGNVEFLDTLLSKPKDHLSVLKFLSGVMEKKESCHLFQKFSHRIQSFSHFNSSFDEKKDTLLSTVWGTCLDCLYESRWGEDCVSCISPLLMSATLLYGKESRKDHWYSDEIENVFYPLVRVQSELCSFDCIINLLKLQRDYKRKLPTANVIDTLVLRYTSQSQLSLLSDELKQGNISISSVEIYYPSGKILNVIKNLTTMIVQSALSKFTLCLLCKEKDGHDEVALKNSIHNLGKACCQNKTLQSFTYFVEADDLHTCVLSDIMTEDLIQNGPSKVKLVYLGAALSDDVHHRYYEFIQQCQTTNTLELRLRYGTQLSMNFVINLIKALKCPSESLKSFTLDCNEIFGNINEVLDVLAANTTLTEIWIGYLQSTAVHSVYNFLKHNRCVKSLSVGFIEYKSEMWDPIKEALEQNRTVKDFTLHTRQYYRYGHSHVHPYILGAVQYLFPSVIRSIETNQCTLKSITFYVRSYDVKDDQVTEIQNITASQQIPTDWSYEYSVTPFLRLIDNNIGYQHTVQLSVN